MSNELLEISQPTGKVFFTAFVGGELGKAIQITADEGYIQLSAAREGRKLKTSVN